MRTLILEKLNELVNKVCTSNKKCARIIWIIRVPLNYWSSPSAMLQPVILLLTTGWFNCQSFIAQQWHRKHLKIKFKIVRLKNKINWKIKVAHQIKSSQAKLFFVLEYLFGNLGHVHVTMSAGWQACRKTCMHGGRQAHRHAPPCNWQTQLVDLGQSQATTVCFLNVLWGFLLLSIKSLISHYKIADASSKKV